MIVLDLGLALGFGLDLRLGPWVLGLRLWLVLSLGLALGLALDLGLDPGG